MGFSYPVSLQSGYCFNWIFLFLSTPPDLLKTLYFIKTFQVLPDLSRHHLIVSEFRRKNFDKMSDKMSGVGPCRSFNCTIELDESAVKEAFAGGLNCFYQKRFEKTPLIPEFWLLVCYVERPNSAKGFTIWISNNSESEFQIVAFNGSRIIGGNLPVKPRNENSNLIFMFFLTFKQYF
jgi:hypothetical protein